MLLSPFGWTWRVGTNDDGVAPAFLRHEALPGLHRATRTLALTADTRFGTLHLVVVDEHGKPIHHGATLKALDCDLEHNDSRIVPPPGGMTWDLPAGLWRLHVLLGKEVVSSPSADSYVRGFHEEVVTIAEGRTTEVKVVAQPAGQVGFRLHSSRPPATGWRNLRFESAGREVAVLAHDRERRERPWQRRRERDCVPPGGAFVEDSQGRWVDTICPVESTFVANASPMWTTVCASLTTPRAR